MDQKISQINNKSVLPDDWDAINILLLNYSEYENNNAAELNEMLNMIEELEEDDEEDELDLQ